MSLMMKELVDEEKPREKFKAIGFEGLSDADLIAILLRTGTKELSVRDLASMILKDVGGLSNLKNASVNSLSQIHGIGEVKAITLLSALELGCRVAKTNYQKLYRIQTAQDLYQLFAPRMQLFSQEHFIAVFLNSKNEMIASKTIFIGTANKSIVHPRDIYREAIKHSAVKMMVLHNHPSGDVTPSKEDISFTKRLIEAGNLLQIPLIDHLIVGQDHYYSFYDHVMK